MLDEWGKIDDRSFVEKLFCRANGVIGSAEQLFNKTSIINLRPQAKGEDRRC